MALCDDRPPALYQLMKKPIQEEESHRMGFSIFGKAHTVLLYGFFPSTDIGQVVCCKNVSVE